MSTMVVTTRITHKYLMNKTKWDLSQMIMMLLDDVDRLTAKVEQLQEERRWIPCSERFPNPGQCVSMWIQPHAYVPGSEKLGAYMPMISPHAPWRSTWDMAYYAPDEITHWRILPEPPTEVCR